MNAQESNTCSFCGEVKPVLRKYLHAAQKEHIDTNKHTPFTITYYCQDCGCREENELLETISSTKAERDGEIRKKVDALHRAKWDFDNKMIPWEKGYTKACEDVLSLLEPVSEEDKGVTN